jgi:Arc/MetJ-type ribon-helix-helix transcriptional regulator
MSEKNRKNEHNTVKLPESLTDEVDKYLGIKGFTSRAEITKQALREFMERDPLPKTEKNLPRFQHVNADSTGIKIFEQSPEGNRIVHVTFSPDGIECDHHGDENCEHVQYALQLADVQEIIQKRKKEGWKLPTTLE